ncbi:MAG TPA: tetratricopeptide repeat protein, partial [Bryobacteraceae bacterium]|nr:tetratricopeptide repeat protein [Bryobacteraceae bacterium]
DRATKFESQGQIPEALKALDEALAAEPGNPTALQHRGRLRLGNKQYADAVADFAVLTKLRPEESSAWQSLGEARLAMNDPSCASAFS